MDETTRTRFEQTTLTQLRALRRRLRCHLVLDGLALVSAAVLASVLVTLGLDRALRLGWDMRLAQLTALLITLAVVAWRLLVQPLRVPIRMEHLAVLIERRHPHLQSRLVSAVEFVGAARAGSRSLAPRSPAMMEAVIHQAQEEASHLRFRDTLNRRRAQWRGGLTLACAASLIVLALATPETMGLWFQRNVLLVNVDWPQKNRLTVEGLTDGQMVVPRGDDAVVSAVVDPGFAAPRQVYIRYESDSGLAGREQMPAVRAEVIRFTHAFERIDETLRCRITGGDAVTDTFTIQVVDRPRIDEARLGIRPPGYTRIEPYELRPGQTVAEVLNGSEIQFRCTVNKPVVKASLIRRIGGEETDLGPAKGSDENPREFTTTDRPKANATYSFLLIDERGWSNLSERARPVRFTVRLAADQPPKVKMKIKGVGEMVTPEAVLPIEMDFSDLYGLASADLLHASARPGAAPDAEPVPGFEPGTKTFAHTLGWSVRAHGLAEGDRLSLHAQARDFDDIAGPNLGKSAIAAFRVVSSEELLSELNRRQQEYRQDFERMLRRQEEDLYSGLLTLSQARDPQDDPQQRARQFTQLARQQRDQIGRLTTLRLQFELVLSELRVNQLSDPTVEARLAAGIIEPMGRLTRIGMPAAAERLDALAPAETPEKMQEARDAQAAVRNEMRVILDHMIKWEGFQEAVIQLRSVLKMQREMMRETETRIESEIFGTRPATEPSEK